jgi:hypothetical protein
MAKKTSESGAYMSKYDTEVENRLTAIEAEIKSIKEGLASHGHASSGSGDDRVDALVGQLNGMSVITQHCSKDSDGVRRIKL